MNLATSAVGFDRHRYGSRRDPKLPIANVNYGNPLSCRRRLTRKALQTQVNACPSWRLCGPNSCRGLRDLRIVQRPSSDEDDMRAGFGFAEKLGTANTTEPPMHLIAAIGNALKIGEIALHRHRLLWKAGIDCPATRAEVLAKSAPAHARNDGRRGHFIANSLAQTPACDQHETSLDSV